MSQQIIISIGREFGSGGHLIAEALANKFDLTLYDNNILEHLAKEMDFDHQALRKYEEKPKLHFFSRTVKGHSTSFSDHIAKMQFKFLQEKADNGESFVVVGRCAESMLSHNKNLISIFILGDISCKITRIKEVYKITSDDEANRLRIRKDWERKSYHNYHCKGKWGDSRNYHLSINSSSLGIDKTVELLTQYINERIKLFR